MFTGYMQKPLAGVPQILIEDLTEQYAVDNLVTENTDIQFSQVIP